MVCASDYSRALYELAREEKTEEAILQEMEAVNGLFQSNPEYVTLLDTPAVSKEQRIALLEEAFPCLNIYHLNFLKILCEKHGIRQYSACADGYKAQYYETHGILCATAVTAVAMSEAQQSALIKKLERMTGKTVQLQNIVDTKVLGGVTLRFGGMQLDGSLQSRLDELRQSLMDTIV